MSDNTTAPQRTDDTPKPLRAIAATIFARHGVNVSTVRRAGGWTNAVWLADRLALRLCTVPNRDHLLREARLATLFPSGVGYPSLVEAGCTLGYAWTLAERLPGTSLGEVWEGLAWQERQVALQGLWTRAEAVHAVPVARAAAIVVPQRAWFNSNDPVEAEAGLARVTGAGALSPSQRRVLRAALARFWEVEAEAPRVLSHGDLTLDNTMWHAGQVSALLDFEYALVAPVQLDLNHLVKAAFGPDSGAVSAAAADARGAAALRETVAASARPRLAQPPERALLMGYAILLELWLLELWLGHPEGEGPLETWAPLRRLRSLAHGDGGYLAPLL